MTQYYAASAASPMYSFTGYMENSRSNGNKQHLITEERNGVTLIDGNAYMWRVRALPNIVSPTMAEGEWSDYALFIKEAQ
jgi:hypothetical protein